MTSPSGGSGDAAARRLVEAVERRAALHEAIGVVRAWSGDVPERFGDTEREAEVARVTAAVDAAAERRSDPDWDD
ncbi:hypothetical protein [Lentzea sp. NEAU-D7]|uniref:hypothetical protein n=1 Tax=Lentzea sp. NEAU-D7 TaxID=2994667 RepID=UPI00224B02B9|nr:hypothetical protein [Lentzea sp. NEAU-D7]MCX2946970.1 hypothetical protein [Lentzea sp. NEAU-D7]